MARGTLFHFEQKQGHKDRTAVRDGGLDISSQLLRLRVTGVDTGPDQQGQPGSLLLAWFLCDIVAHAAITDRRGEEAILLLSGCAL